MYRYSEIVISCEGLGELVLFRSVSNARAQLYRRSIANRTMFGAKPKLRDVTSSRPKQTGLLQSNF
ncbi:hypothetical protein DET61_11643 [Marinobacter nauticus]|jgi:hypothetical protein|uniref:Uncharacterized protein n=1 Tax=Marinobacter nauticus TaxID=2743 RepID=A0A368X7M2_MARNT|nr:hypothetical protein DET61_11643 [Marinobacter nauticus]